MLSRNVDELRLDVRRQAVEARGEPPAVVAQFATRGALASLRVVERKLDRLSQQLNRQRAQGGAQGCAQGGAQGAAEEATGPLLALAGGGQLVVRCHTAPSVMDILKDVSAKVRKYLSAAPARPAPPLTPRMGCRWMCSSTTAPWVKVRTMRWRTQKPLQSWATLTLWMI